MITPAYSPTATERVLPRMALDFTTGVLDSRVTVTRALNTATRVNSSGAIEIVNANLPRFDYDPATLAPKGLLIEETRTNVALTSTFATLAGSAGSQYPSGTGWSNFFNTSGTRTYVASSVFSGAQAMNIASVTAGRNVIGFSFTAVSSTTYTVSFYVESVSGVTGTVAYASGTLGTGGTTNLVSAPTTTGRYTYTFTTGLLAGSVDLRFGIGTSGNESGSIRISNVQCEVGAFATSYIPTTTTTLTRNADGVSMTGTNFSSWYNASEGTLVASGQFVALGNNTSPYRNALVGLSDGTSANAMTFGKSIAGFAADRPATFSSNGNFGQSIAGVTITASSIVTMALGLKANSVFFAANGVAGVEDTSCSVPIANQLGIGNFESAGLNSLLNGYIRSVRYYPRRLTNAEIQAFSK